MQMNIYIPKERQNLLAALERAAKRTGRPKNELVLEALGRYLDEMEKTVELGRFHLGPVKLGTRDELYRGRLE